MLTSEPLGWRDVALGVVLATVFWEALQPLGGYYVRHSLAHANATYGFFAIVIGLLSWLFVAAQLTLYAAEINVVRRSSPVATLADPAAADPSRPGHVRAAGDDGRAPARGEGQRSRSRRRPTGSRSTPWPTDPAQTQAAAPSSPIPDP